MIFLLKLKKKIAEIIDLQMKHAFIRNKEQIGKTHKVLVEGVSKSKEKLTEEIQKILSLYFLEKTTRLEIMF